MSPSPIRFRAAAASWVLQLALPCGFFLLLIYTLMQAFQLPVPLAAFGWSLVLLIFAGDAVVPMLANWLQADGEGITGSLNGQPIRVEWGEVIAAWRTESQRGPLVCLGTRCRTWVLPLRYLNERAVWNQIAARVPGGALEASARERLPDFSEWLRLEEGPGSACSEPVDLIDPWASQISGWGGLSVSVVWCVLALRGGAFLEAGLALVGLLVALTLILGWGITEIGSERVERNLLFSGWQLDWEEITWIETDPFDLVLVLGGKGRRLALPGPALWSSSVRRRALQRLMREAERRHIPMRRNVLALFKPSRRTRMAK